MAVSRVVRGQKGSESSRELQLAVRASDANAAAADVRHNDPALGISVRAEHVMDQLAAGCR